MQRGLAKGVTGRVRIAQFNDPDLLREALAPGDVALVLTEPAMTNWIHLLAPEPGWHDALRALTREHGTLLAIDETHTHVVGYGGATGLWQLDPDIVTIGKAVAGGVPMGAYGVTAEPGRAAGRGPQRRHRRHPVRQPAVGRRGPGGADRGAAARGLRAHHRPGRRAGRRDRAGHRRGRPAVDAPSGSAPRSGPVVRARSRAPARRRTR